MTVEQTIRQNADRPLGESIAPIASSLARHRVLLATDEMPSKATRPTTAMTRPTTGPATQAGSFAELVHSIKKPGTTIEFKSGQDAQGRVWAYAYTSEAEFARAFPRGHHATEVSFRHFFGMIEGDPHFSGIRLNPGSDASYAIPRESFETIKERLRPPAER